MAHSVKIQIFLPRSPVPLTKFSLPMLSSSIKHYAGRLCIQAVVPDTKFGLLWPYTAGGIGPVATAGGTALLSHQAPAQHCTALPSILSHYVVKINSANTSYATDAAQPHEDLWKSDLWQHLKNVSGSSFARSIKRKQEREADQALCAAMDSMRVSRRFSLCDEFKRVCIRESNVSSPCLVQSADVSKILLEKDVKDGRLQCAQPPSTTPGFDKPSLQRKCLGLDVIGNGETSSAYVHCSANSQPSSC